MNEKLEGVFEGVGETRGDWDVFTQFTAELMRREECETWRVAML